MFCDKTLEYFNIFIRKFDCQEKGKWLDFKRLMINLISNKAWTSLMRRSRWKTLKCTLLLPLNDPNFALIQPSKKTQIRHFLAPKQSLNYTLKKPPTHSNWYPKLALFMLSNLLVKNLTQFWLQTPKLFYPNFAKFKRTKKITCKVA
jgi:hypothetical protein